MTISFLQLLWKSPQLQDVEQAVNRLVHELGVSKAFAQILVSRNLTQPKEVDYYLNPSLEHCHDPFLMHDMQVAVDRILLALKRREKIVVYGDYDVDGTAATVVLYKFLKRIGVRAYYFIPDRMRDGYGMTPATLRELKLKQTNIIITVDNGSTAVEESRILHEMGMELIITDHHQLGTQTPLATAILNPQQVHCKYPFKGLCGTGVAFKLIEALDQVLTQENYWDSSGYIRPNIQRELDLVAFATIADRMPLVDENRYFVKEGLTILNTSPRPGLLCLIKESNIRGTITPNLISFKLAPKINAAGRLRDPLTGAKLLLSHSLSEAKPFATELNQVNSERQTIERQIMKSAMSLASLQLDKKVIILINEHWHPGVIGSVAAKIAGRFQKPTIALTHSSGNKLVGSIRSAGNLDVCNALQNCAGFLEKFGGHKAAAGLSLLSQNLNEFCVKFLDLMDKLPLNQEEPLEESLQIDAWVEASDLQEKLAQEIMQMSPFGAQNPEPVLGIRNTFLKAATIFGNKHLKFSVDTPNCNIEVYAWERSDWFSKLTGIFDLALSPQIYSETVNDLRLQFKVVDIKPIISST